MTKLILLALLLGGTALPALAADAPASSHEAGASLRYVDMDKRGSLGKVYEYNGKLNKYLNGDVWFSNQGEYGLLDFRADGFGSKEESGSLFVDYKDSLRLRAQTASMHHRRDYIRDYVLVNGVFTPFPEVVAAGIAVNYIAPMEFMFRRTQSELNLDLFNSKNPAQFFSVEYFQVDKKGQAAFRTAQFGSASNEVVTGGDVNNIKQEVAFTAGTNIRENAAVAMEVVHSEFRDYSNNPLTNAWGRISKPKYAKQQMTGASLKFRYDPSKDLAVTGAFTGNSWDNVDTQYNKKTIVGSLNAVYKVSPKLSLTGKAYLRAFQVFESEGYVSPAAAAGSGNQFDKTTLRADLVANYKAMEKLRLSGSYRIEVNNRRDAQSSLSPSTGNRYYSTQGGVLTFTNGSKNLAFAHNDVKNIAGAKAVAELPLGIEADAQYKHLWASRPAFANSPDRQDNAVLTVTVPLPQDVELTLVGEYLDEAGHMQPWNYKSTQDAYRAALDWHMNSKVTLGADGSFESIRRGNTMLFGSGATGTTYALLHPTGGNPWAEEVITREKNTTAGGHGRFVLPAGFVVSGNGSYTWMVINSWMSWPITGLGFPVGTTLNDMTPRDVRVARGSAVVEYTPAKYKSLTARASYRIDDWVDKFDNNNNGRASVGELGVSAKF